MAADGLGNKNTALVRASQTALATAESKEYSAGFHTVSEQFEQWKSRFWRKDPEHLVKKALKQKQDDFLALLIECGHGRQTFLKSACNGNLEDVERFVNNGMPVDTKAWLIVGNNPNEITALMGAANKGHKHIVEFLLVKNANPTIICNNRNTAQDYANKNCFYELAQTLEAHEKTWQARQTSNQTAAQQSPAIAAPPLTKTARAEPPPLPTGWSVMIHGGAKMVTRTVSDEESGVTIKDVFDFDGDRLITSFSDAAGPGEIIEKQLSSLKAPFCKQARALLDQALTHEEQQKKNTKTTALPDSRMT